MGTLRSNTSTKTGRAAGVLAGAVAIAAAGLAAAPAASAETTGAPCGPKAAACVDLSAKRAWLMSDGKVTYGPVPMSAGKPGYRTPPGTFAVTWKNKDHWSKAYDAPMPYAVFFTKNGIAFHEGDISRESHGCVRLRHEAAKTFFAELQPGEVVQVVR
ncbi:L,D-transpeptidase catalytic domain [Amycolatopsis arida]|uniref:L,D-transpeptidase catalytic domain n=1 Tax=Amycolatopsis arida TaxID=587909 RepID=A0A1I5SZV6_9PSEU|nr:L,D-transpeptidase [Amycolatopsis arida]TDX96283.1 L,D-transpeptidase-like protein [Amycolatopsis arida]SFP76300.1 L,D-transpeptidase catalytic domain [Amycolatopsis arida]